MAVRKLFNGIFGLEGTRKETSAVESVGRKLSKINAHTNRIICFRIDDELDRKLARALSHKGCSRSVFIRLALERVLQAEAEERLRAAHSAIDWG
jgi:hypothetical protein